MTISNLQQETDQSFMLQALALAEKGKYSTLPNPCVGCILTKNGIIIGSGFHKKAGTGHAEVNALADARNKGNDTSGSTAYVTLEPCVMCAGAIVSSRIKKVYIGTMEDNSGACGTKINILKNKKLNTNIEIEKNICKEECEKILKEFFKERRG